MPQCRACKQHFEIDPAVGGAGNLDRAFYAKIEVPPPTHCPQCRQQRRLAWRNERTLYKRACDLCNKNLISIYPAQTPWPVYCNECWWSDKWDPMDFGAQLPPPNPNQSFFEQYAALQQKVPRLAIYLKNSENSEYCNHSEAIKNSYLCVDTTGEDIFYSKWIIGGCRDLADCYQLEKSELCYESLYSVGAYNCKYAILSDNSRDSAFIYNCRGVANCYMSWNLNHKEYNILNKQFSRQEYEDQMKKVDLGSYEIFEKSRTKFLQLLDEEIPRRAQVLINSENASGDMIYNSKNVHDSYDVIESEDSRYCYDAGFLKDCYDTYEAAFNCELQYDSHACNRGTRLRFSHVSYDVDSCDYIDSCHNSNDLFGCIGLRRKKYCILNRQYTKEEFEKVRSEFIEKMKERGEFGEFFPIQLSPYGYNETVAQEYFPLQKEEALSRAYKWSDQASATKVTAQPTLTTLPDNIKDTPASSRRRGIAEEILHCTECTKPYRMTSQEVALYKKLGVPLPRKCHLCRHAARLELRNQQWLQAATCAKCGVGVQAALPRRRRGVVYCEGCFRDER